MDHTVTFDYQQISFDAARMLMDDDICEELHSRLGDCDLQKFFDCYLDEHYIKYQQDWEFA